MIVPTPSTALLALMASMLLSGSTEALPTRGSSSLVSRHGRIARRQAPAAASPSASPKSHNIHIDGSVSGSTINVNFNGKGRRSEDSSSTGDHSILIDASSGSSAEGASGGIKNSTINLTVISRRHSSSSILSSIQSRIRSLALQFRAADSSSSFSDFSAKISEPAPKSVSYKKQGRGLEDVPRDMLVKRFGKLMERSDAYVTDLAAQQSIYSAAVAALGESTSTTAAATTPSVKVLAVANSTSTPVAAAVTPTASAPISATSTSSAATALPTLLQTIVVTLVPQPDGHYVDAAQLDTVNSTLGATSTASLAIASTTPAAIAIASTSSPSPSSTISSSSIALASSSTATPTPSLATSPPASTFTSTLVGAERRSSHAARAVVKDAMAQASHQRFRKHVVPKGKFDSPARKLVRARGATEKEMEGW
ncbi:hypothetical protein MNV49_001792 [Pseudohyphozyma bogoriensis]|nr:hypothetical protein MNV49_001792 [Pseudohyphozyma bogoriensis]